jgi:hypothetical protein
LPFAPVCAAVGAWLALAPGRARGEDRALAAIGRSPWQRHAAAILGGAAIALAAAAAIAAPTVDVRGFYPRPEPHATWRATSDGFASSDGQWRVGGDGAPSAVSATSPGARPDRGALPPLARASASLATAALGLALPMLAALARRRTIARVAASVLATSLALVLAFQAAAASRATPLVAPLPPLLLLAAAASLYSLGGGPWRRAKSPR